MTSGPYSDAAFATLRVPTSCWFPDRIRAAEQAHFASSPESGHENLSAGNGQFLDMFEKSIRSNRR